MNSAKNGCLGSQTLLSSQESNWRVGTMVTNEQLQKHSYFGGGTFHHVITSWLNSWPLYPTDGLLVQLVKRSPISFIGPTQLIRGSSYSYLVQFSNLLLVMIEKITGSGGNGTHDFLSSVNSYYGGTLQKQFLAQMMTATCLCMGAYARHDFILIKHMGAYANFAPENGLRPAVPVTKMHGLGLVHGLSWLMDLFTALCLLYLS